MSTFNDNVSFGLQLKLSIMNADWITDCVQAALYGMNKMEIVKESVYVLDKKPPVLELSGCQDTTTPPPWPPTAAPLAAPRPQP